MTGSSIRARARTASSTTTRKVMLSNRGVLLPERTLRKAFTKAGLQFAQNVRPIQGMRCTADFLFPSGQLCVFVDGCFWHGCPRHFTPPKRNRSWWKEKIEDNKARDKRQRSSLRLAGWRVIRVWEHDLVKIGRVLSRIRRALTHDRSERKTTAIAHPKR